MKTKLFNRIVLVQAITLALVACGGGGSGGGSNSSETSAPTTPAPEAPATPTNPPQTGGTLQTTAPATTYADNTGEKAAFNYLQSVRTSCGFGAVHQNTKLDAASLAHSNYLLQGSSATVSLIGHYETDTTNPFYTGNRSQDRASAAGYGERVAEILSASAGTYFDTALASAPTSAARGLDAMRGLLNTVAHLSGAMSEARSVGFGSMSKNFASTQGGTSLTTVQYRFGALLGSQEGTQLLGAGNVASYPCAATQDAEYAFAPATEDPNPFPSITDPTVQVGPPIYLRADPGAVLKVDSFSLKDSTGAAVAVRTDVGVLLAHEFFMVPSTKLQAGTVYTVNLKGSANGQAFDRTFSFKTKA